MTSLRPQVSVVIPAFGPPAPLLEAVGRLLEMTALQIEIVVVDNDPSRRISELLPRAPRLRLLEPGYNTGFTGAINRGIAESSGEFVLFHNTDLLLSGDYLPALVSFMQEHPNAGLCSGKVLRDAASEGRPAEFDTAGIELRRDRSAFDRGEGEADEGQFDEPQEVFSVSGAALLARRSALEDVAIDGRTLDETYFMYKDDIDLGWRMRLRGWECWYVPEAVAFHARGGRGMGGQGYLASMRGYWRNEVRKAPHVRLHSLKNEWLLLLTYESKWSFLRALPAIAARQLMLIGVTALVSPRSLVGALIAFARAVPAARRKRDEVFTRATVSAREIRRRWVL